VPTELFTPDGQRKYLTEAELDHAFRHESGLERAKLLRSVTSVYILARNRMIVVDQKDQAGDLLFFGTLKLHFGDGALMWMAIETRVSLVNCAESRHRGW
jgi:hypothetical protein